MATLGSSKKISTPESEDSSQILPECFVLMPISDCDSHPPGHFLRVFHDIIVPACRMAGYRATRADQVSSSNLIQLDILSKLLECPMALCDLSTANPNVLFELGLRQAFDKPVSLIQEIGTRQIFDINNLRYISYRKERFYDEVIADQKAIARCIEETAAGHKDGTHINSIVKLLELTKPATLSATSEETKQTELTSLILREINDLKRELKRPRPPENDRERDREISDIFGAAEAIISETRRSIYTESLDRISVLDEYLANQINILNRLTLSSQDDMRIRRKLNNEAMHFRQMISERLMRKEQ